MVRYKFYIVLYCNSAFHPSRVGKWVPASAGKAKAGMVHSVSRCMLGVQIKLWDPLRMRAIPEHLRGVIMTRRYTNPQFYLYRTVNSIILAVRRVPGLCSNRRQVVYAFLPLSSSSIISYWPKSSVSLADSTGSHCHESFR